MATIAAALTAAAKAIAAAKTQLGKPYRFGAEAPGVAFDCSGLTQWAYHQAGISIPRIAAQQQAATTRISKAQLAPGDLVFYGNPAHHVAIYLGAGKIIQAPHTGARIDIVNMGSPTNFGRVRGSGAAATPGAAGTTALGGSSGAGPPTATAAFIPFGPELGFLGGLWKDVSGVPSTIGDVAQSIDNVVNDFGQIMRWLTWLFNPAHWLRVSAAVVGLAVVLGGLYFLQKAAGGPRISDAAQNMPPIIPV